MTPVQPSGNRDERTGVLLLLAGSTFISFSAVFVKLAHVGPTTSGIYRNLFACIALLVVVASRRETLWRGSGPLLWAVLAGVFFAADIWCWHRSVLYIGPGLATIMGNFQVFVMAFAGIVVFGEKVSWRFVVSIPLAIAGLFLLVGSDWGGLDRSYRVGVGLGLATAACYGAYLLTLRYAQRGAIRLGATANLAVITLVTALLLALTEVRNPAALRIPDAHTWLVLVAYGVVCGALGWIVISQALRHVDASRVGLLLLLQPTLTFIWDIAFFQRPTTLLEALGAMLAVGAIYLGTTRRAGSRA